ncbi:hypothetical protein LX36DRAFT_673521 [Colletotrichum falcatum]|nr:hypothetical protein LX36DRAFT_673521 [Colletotrichum falcatum]
MHCPWRLPEFTPRFQGRNDLLGYAAQKGVPVSSTKAKPCSHCSYEAGMLEVPDVTPPEDMWTMTAQHPPTSRSALRRHPCQPSLDFAQERVDGEVRLQLYKGQAYVLGRRSPGKLYSEEAESTERCALPMIGLWKRKPGERRTSAVPDPAKQARSCRWPFTHHLKNP